LALDAELNRAISSFNKGEFDHAKSVCERILVEDPDNVVALNIFWGSLARMKRLPQAIQVAERVCSLSPGNGVYCSNLSYLLSVTGNIPKAILVMAQAIFSDRENTVYQTKFARMIDHLEFYRGTAETVVIKDAISICMRNPGIDVTRFSTAWHSLLLLDPVFTKIATLTQRGDFEVQAEQVDFKELIEPLNAPFLLSGLESLHATNAKFERIMTFFRHLFLSRLDDYDADNFLPFLCALAEHCHLNEFVYSFTKEERLAVDTLAAGLDLAARLEVDTMARIAIFACYRELAHIDCVESIARAGAEVHNDAFTKLIKNTITIPGKISEYRETIASVPSQDDPVKYAVSSSVAKQYEENPYPRWRHLEIPELTEQQKSQGRGRAILIAGCGTGYEPLNMAVRYPEARVVGVDLSVPSLAYGKQKADEFSIDNVEFIQADILDLENLGQQFDLITCVGVLHHMEDPVAGWNKLLACLKPDGFMKIALYSESARQSVVQ